MYLCLHTRVHYVHVQWCIYIYIYLLLIHSELCTYIHIDEQGSVCIYGTNMHMHMYVPLHLLRQAFELNSTQPRTLRATDSQEILESTVPWLTAPFMDCIGNTSLGPALGSAPRGFDAQARPRCGSWPKLLLPKRGGYFNGRTQFDSAASNQMSCLSYALPANFKAAPELKSNRSALP